MAENEEQLGKMLAELVLWVRSAAIRLSAQEQIIKGHLSVSEEEWAEALARAETAVAQWEPEGLKGIPAVIDLLKHL